LKRGTLRDTDVDGSGRETERDNGARLDVTTGDNSVIGKKKQVGAWSIEVVAEADAQFTLIVVVRGELSGSGGGGTLVIFGVDHGCGADREEDFIELKACAGEKLTRGAGKAGCCWGEVRHHGDSCVDLKMNRARKGVGDGA
jgi:hypothetical protein